MSALQQSHEHLNDLHASVAESSSTSLPEGWAELLDPDSGETYFYHASSGEVTWERPGTLPAGWSTVVDPDSGATYYYQEHSGETSWEMPGTHHHQSGGFSSLAVPTQAEEEELA